VNTMRDVFYDFEWRVAPDYEWRDWLDDQGRSVVVPPEGLGSLESPAGVELLWNRAYKAQRKYGPVLQAAEGSPIRTYRPMEREHAALFRTFGDLDYRDSASLLAFAKTYGHIGLPQQDQHVQIPAAKGARPYHWAHGEPYLDWALEICFMREAIRATGRSREAQDAERLKWLFDRNLQHFQGRLRYGSAGEPLLVFQPLTLLSAMWLQLALSVTGDKRFEQCKFCGRLFEISTDLTGFRSHRQFCTDTCKTNDYRKRKRIALKLAAGGIAVREIAKKTNTERATVQGWLRRTKDAIKRQTGVE
jgi:hypothetical protein